jgi:hypothetical protein
MQACDAVDPRIRDALQIRDALRRLCLKIMGTLRGAAGS